MFNECVVAWNIVCPPLSTPHNVFVWRSPWHCQSCCHNPHSLNGRHHRYYSHMSLPCASQSTHIDGNHFHRTFIIICHSIVCVCFTSKCYVTSEAKQQWMETDEAWNCRSRLIYSLKDAFVFACRQIMWPLWNSLLEPNQSLQTHLDQFYNNTPKLLIFSQHFYKNNW